MWSGFDPFRPVQNHNERPQQDVREQPPTVTQSSQKHGSGKKRRPCPPIGPPGLCRWPSCEKRGRSLRRRARSGVQLQGMTGSRMGRGRLSSCSLSIARFSLPGHSASPGSSAQMCACAVEGEQGLGRRSVEGGLRPTSFVPTRR